MSDGLSALHVTLVEPPCRPKRCERRNSIVKGNKVTYAAIKMSHGVRKQKGKGGYPGDYPTLQEALNSPDRDMWIEAILKELAQLEAMKSWRRLNNYYMVLRRTLHPQA